MPPTPTPAADELRPGDATLEELAAGADATVDDASIEEELTDTVLRASLVDGRTFEFCLDDVTARHVRLCRALGLPSPEDVWRTAAVEKLGMELVEQIIAVSRVLSGEESVDELGIRRRDIKGVSFESRPAAPLR